MSAKRIAIAGFQHETNTFCPIPTIVDDFEKADAWPALTTGAQVIEVFSPLNIPIGGFINAARSWQLRPIVWASAEPAGLIEKQAFEHVCGIICQGIEDAGYIDGVYLDLHGAMVAEGYADGELEIVRRVRQIIGDDVPLVCSLDFHANISAQFVDKISAMTIFRHYPHTDMAETGARAAKIMQHLVNTDQPLYKSFHQIDYLIPLSSQGTTHFPFNEIYADFDQLQNNGVLSVDAAAGFPAADIADCGPSVISYGTVQQNVEDAANSLLNRFSQAESKFTDPLLTADNAVKMASALIKENPEPVVLADVQDNPGAGASSDTSEILQTLITQDSARAIVGVICDPDSVKQCWRAGVGSQLELALGDRYPVEQASGFSHQYSVEQLSDEPIRCTGQMYGGCDADLGAMAVIRCTSTHHEIFVVLSSQRFQCLDLALFRQMKLKIELPQIIVVKSTIHFLTDFEPVAQTVLFVEASGLHPCKLSKIRYKNLRPGVRVGPMGNINE